LALQVLAIHSAMIKTKDMIDEDGYAIFFLLELYHAPISDIPNDSYHIKRGWKPAYDSQYMVYVETSHKYAALYINY